MIQTHFRCCPLILVFSSRKRNNLISQVHKRLLRTAGEFLPSSIDRKSSFESNNGLSIHQRNVELLMTETIKLSLNTLLRL